MSAPVCHFAAGIIAPSHPAQKHRVKLVVFCRALPCVPVETFRNRLFLVFFGYIVAERIIARLNELDLAKFTFPDDAASVLVETHRALLRTDLKDLLRFSNDVDELTTFGNVRGERLFRIDVQACENSVSGGDCATMILRNDERGVEFFIFEEFDVGIIHVPLFALFNETRPLLFVNAVDHLLTPEIRNSDDSSTLLRNVFHKLTSAAACSDEADDDAVVGADFTRSGQRRTGN